MIHAAVSAIILLAIYKYMNVKGPNRINSGIAFIFILVPSALIFGIRVGLDHFGWSQNYALIAYVLYFFLPYLFLKYALDYQSGLAVKYALIVPIVAILTAIPFAYYVSTIV